MIKRKNIKEIWLVIYMFIFLFAPPIITSINLLIPLSMYSLFIVIIKYKSKLNKLFKKKDFQKIVLVLILYFAFYIISTLINSINEEGIYSKNYILNIYSFILNFPLTIICSIYLTFKFDEENKSMNDMIRYFIYAGLIQSFLAVIALMSSSCRQWMLLHMLNANTEKFINSPWIIERRFYGFSNNMLDLFGFGTGVLAALPLYYAKSNNKYKYILLIPILLIVPILNSRTGIVILALGIICFIIGMVIKREISPTIFIKYLIIIIVFILLVFLIVKAYSPNTIDWIKNDFLSFLNPSESTGTANILFDKSWWTLPEPKYFLLGTGLSITGYSDYATNISINSDVGYINEFWRTGIIGSIIIYYFLFLITKLAQKNLINNKVYNTMFSFFLIASFITLIKGYVFSYNPGNVVIYTLVIMLIYSSKNRGEIDE